jgi:hypothetical protein
MRLLVEFLITNHQCVVTESFKNGPSIFGVNCGDLVFNNGTVLPQTQQYWEGLLEYLFLTLPVLFHHCSILTLHSSTADTDHLKHQQRRNILSTSLSFPQNYHQISKLGPPPLAT